MLGLVRLSQGESCCVESGYVKQPLSRLASVRLRASRSGMDCGEARWVVLMRANVGCGLLCRGNHHRAGTEADQRGRGGMKSGEMVRGELVCGKACCVLASNHARAGTGLDQRQRRGMGSFRLSMARQCRLWHG